MKVLLGLVLYVPESLGSHHAQLLPLRCLDAKPWERCICTGVDSSSAFQTRFYFLFHF